MREIKEGLLALRGELEAADGYAREDNSSRVPSVWQIKNALLRSKVEELIALAEAAPPAVTIQQVVQITSDPENQPSQFGTVPKRYAERAAASMRERAAGIMLAIAERQTKWARMVIPPGRARMENDARECRERAAEIMALPLLVEEKSNAA